jgi:hypothetical protein
MVAAVAMVVAAAGVVPVAMDAEAAAVAGSESEL